MDDAFITGSIKTRRYLNENIIKQVADDIKIVYSIQWYR